MACSVRPDLADLEPYDPDMRPVRIMLSANENNWGMPDDVAREAQRRLAGVALNRYPEATSPRLRELLGQMWDVPAHRVVVANGGDELLFNLLLAYGGKGRVLVNCPPTFSAYELYAKLTATSVVNVNRDANTFELDEDGLLEAARDPRAALVVVTSPNNPTGNLTSVDFVRKLAQATSALVLVDEAYAEFCDAQASCVPLVAELPNVCVLRTMSKAYALAGARVGYLICPDDVADCMLAVRRRDARAARRRLDSRAKLLAYARSRGLFAHQRRQARGGRRAACEPAPSPGTVRAPHSVEGAFRERTKRHPCV